MLHLPGSLSNLADDFLKGTSEKGSFPHFFNREEFRHYKGPIPDDKYYDLAYSIKDETALMKHKKMKASWIGKEWNAEQQLFEYCLNDVVILAEVLNFISRTQ
jgi:DNA polymerase type B, organellar and viral